MSYKAIIVEMHQDRHQGDRAVVRMLMPDVTVHAVLSIPMTDAPQYHIGQVVILRLEAA